MLRIYEVFYKPFYTGSDRLNHSGKPTTWPNRLASRWRKPTAYSLIGSEHLALMTASAHQEPRAQSVTGGGCLRANQLEIDKFPVYLGKHPHYSNDDGTKSQFLILLIQKQLRASSFMINYLRQPCAPCSLLSLRLETQRERRHYSDNAPAYQDNQGKKSVLYFS